MTCRAYISSSGTNLLWGLDTLVSRKLSLIEPVDTTVQQRAKANPTSEYFTKAKNKKCCICYFIDCKSNISRGMLHRHQYTVYIVQKKGKNVMNFPATQQHQKYAFTVQFHTLLKWLPQCDLHLI